MSSRKASLKKLVESERRLAPEPGAFRGTTTFATRRSVYRFQDGVCVAINHQDNAGSHRGAFVGMQLVGWLGDDGHVSLAWSPEASAVLIRQGSDGDSLVLTSAVIQHRREEPRTRSGFIPRTAPPSHRANGPDSRTRMHAR